MKWFEPIIIIVVVAFVGWVIYSNFFKKGKKSSCSDSNSKCLGSCSSCNIKCYELTERYHKANGYRYLIHVDGMKCGSCETHINDTIRKQFNVKSVSASRTDGKVVVISTIPLNIKDIKKSISDLGYTVY